MNDSAASNHFPVSDVAYCQYCGEHDGTLMGSVGEFHCVDGGNVPPEMVHDLVAAAAEEPPSRRRWNALDVLRGISDSRAVPVLMEAAHHGDERIRAAAILALGRLRVATAIPALAAALDDSSERVHEAAVTGLARIGSREAVEALAGALPDRPYRSWIAEALAWLCDDRAFDAVRAALERDIDWSGDGRLVEALGGLEDPRATPTLITYFDRLMSEYLALGQPLYGVQPMLFVLWVLRRRGDAEAVAAADEREKGLRAVAALPHPAAPTGCAGASSPSPLPPRTVPRWSLELHEVDAPVLQPVTKFGGQPVWVGEPTWPLTRARTPMTFFAQFRLPWSASVHMAYLFIDPTGEETWDGEAGDNVLIVQPATGSIHVPVVGVATGPTYRTGDDPPDPAVYRDESYHRFVESVPTLAPGLDPPAWDRRHSEFGGLSADDEGDWNKLGGTPRFLQGEAWPPGEGWRFLFQFSADTIGHEFGDAAECYGFVHADGRGWFLWQCH